MGVSKHRQLFSVATTLAACGTQRGNRTLLRIVFLSSTATRKSPVRGMSISLCTRFSLMRVGETEEQFEATCDLVREVGFDRVNTAAYSPRPATPAAEWENQVGCYFVVQQSCAFRGYTLQLT